VSSGAGAFSRSPWARLKLGEAAGGWLPKWSHAAALRAVRATVVMPALFALTLKGFGNLQMALFAGFGSFATLVLVSFSGTARDKLFAHIGLALAGSVLLVIGTAVASTPVLAVIVAIPATFFVFFAGVAGPNAANAVNGALLTFVLPAASPGTPSMIPDRLAGWWLASVAGTIAVLALPTPSAGAPVRSAVARLGDVLADAVEAVVRGEATDELVGAVLATKRELMATFSATPFRPTGLAVRDQALANAVELLEWCTALVCDTLREQPELDRAPEPDRRLLFESARVLRDSAALFGKGTHRPDLESLDARRKESMHLAKANWHDGTQPEDDPRVAFHANTIATAVLAIGANALLAARLTDAGELAQARARWFDDGRLPRPGRLTGVRTYSEIATRHASLRSVWFVNSIRGSLALAAAIAVADASSVQHGFWVVLGTLSVLRTNASATGATAVRALLGTVIGFVVGGALLIAVGTSTAVLWLVLPLAVLIASYAPGTAPFVVGQAAFTVTVVVLFNLLVPVGWKVGELRVEDVAIGCLVSVVVGAVFWPRGVTPVVADDLSDAYRTGADYLREAIAWVCGRSSEPPVSGLTALTASQRLDEGVRGLLAEQGTKHLRREELWRLIGGTLRLRLTAHAIADLPRSCANHPPSLDAIEARATTLVDWYQQLALTVGNRRRRRMAGPLTRLRPDGAADLDDGATSQGAVWLQEHLDHLTENADGLLAPARHVADVRSQPWWR
jgi:uncharacterized membrane protein YccC